MALAGDEGVAVSLLGGSPDREDHLFPLPGARAAHERIAAHYADADAAGGYTGQFYDGPHKFDLAMQRAAFTWLRSHLHPKPHRTGP